MAPYTPSRRTVLKQGALLSGMAVVGSAGFAGSAAASFPEHCPRTPGYWKNHPDDWPTDGPNGPLDLPELCDTSYSQDQLIEWLGMSPKGDKTIIMAKHVIAAKLSLLVSEPEIFEEGCKREVEGIVDNAEKWLCDVGIESGVKGPWPDDTEEWKDALDAFNNGNYCECEEPNGGEPASVDGTDRGPASSPRGSASYLIRQRIGQLLRF